MIREVKSNFFEFFQLALTQVGNFLIPFILIPYISRAFGTSGFGIFNYGIASISLISLILNFGFEYASVQWAVKLKNSKGRITVLFWNLVATKFLLFSIGSIVVLFILYFAFQPSREQLLVILVLNILNLGNILNLQWLFQAFSKMKIFSLTNLFFKIAYALSSLIWVKSKDDLMLYCFFYAISQLLPQIGLTIYAIKIQWIYKFQRINLKYMIILLLKTVKMFTSMVFINIYTTSNILMLEKFVSSSEIGVYTSANKLITISNSILILPLSLLFFPKIADSVLKDPKIAIKMIIQITLVILILTVPVGLFLFLFSDKIVLVVFGSDFRQASELIKMGSLLPILIGLSNLWGIQSLLNFKKEKYFLIITIITSFLSLLLNYFLDQALGIKGAMASWLLCESFVTLSFGLGCYFYLKGYLISPQSIS